MATYKTVMRPALEYASSRWPPLVSSTSINKLQVMQNAALRTATGCTQDTNIQHLHDETLTLPIHEHLQLHASQYKQKTQHPSDPLHKHTTYFNTIRFVTNRVRIDLCTDKHQCMRLNTQKQLSPCTCHNSLNSGMDDPMLTKGPAVPTLSCGFDLHCG